ncbi:MAG: 1-acyl-sn-glycerol-3-phosphate acyltransferase [Clostridia bacterium]|nr:1-acyl-sn-glycerol-3-phosphate acyltransferase [Clostridia bacterium]
MGEETTNTTAENAELANNTQKNKLTKFEKWFRFLHRAQRFLALGMLPVKKYGCTEKFNDRSYIIVANHKSNLDVVLAIMPTDKPVHFMAKKELFEKGIGKWFTRKCECIPVNRDGTDVRAIMQAMKYLKEGSVVCIFPEGTRNKTTERFLPFKSGAAALSIKTKTPIIPVVQLKKIELFRKSKVYIGEPFELTEFYGTKLTPQDIERADEILLQKFNEIYQELETLTAKKKTKKQ